MSEFSSILNKVLDKNDLSIDESKSMMNAMMSGDLSNTQIAGFLCALRTKGETIDEISGMAMVMREKATRLSHNYQSLVDTCGTGGDASGTFNISTSVALLLAAGGYKVAKHGNRSVTSKSGSADVLEALGVNLDIDAHRMLKCIDQVGVGFLFAPKLHSAMKYVAPVRKELKIRTVFNVLGPLTNPANATHQVIGVFSEKLVSPLAHVLKNLGLRSAYVVHGYDGLDEVTITTTTKVAHLTESGDVQEFDFDPLEYGFQKSSLSELKGGSPEENASIIQDILAGDLNGPKRDIVVLNAGFAISLLDQSSLQDGFSKAKDIISSGSGLDVIEKLKSVSNS